ncbi:MAG: IMP dehydrogenase [Kiritimatiellia bacterium]
MVTRRDIWYLEDDRVKVSDVMTPAKKLITGLPGYKLEDARRGLAPPHRKLPLVDKKGRLVGLMTGADIENTRYQNAAKDRAGVFGVGAMIGGRPRLQGARPGLVAAGADALFIDAATGHTRIVLSVLDTLKSLLPGAEVVVGNVVTEKGAADLIKAGAAAVKVGVGPGSICTTRVISGVGVPQFTAIQNVAKTTTAARNPGIADGGLRLFRRRRQGLCFGALYRGLDVHAGTEESPGSIIRSRARLQGVRGMGSMGAP